MVKTHPQSFSSFFLISSPLIFYTLNLFVSSQDTTGFFYCSDTFCEEVLRLKPCPAKNNCTTVGFRTFLDPSPCNCCDYCFDYLKENDTCSPTSPQKPIAMCGPYLGCDGPPLDKPEEPSTCQLITNGPKGQPTPDPDFCMAKRKEFMDSDADGTLGVMQFLPECDAGGRYAPRQCIPGSLCYCSNFEGVRVFGQALPHEKQDCACARDVAKLEEYGFKGRLPHCLSNGDYDELQCVVRSCFCRSYPNVTVNPRNMTDLPCYNPSIHVYDPVTPLFYVKPCELQRAQAEIEIAEALLNNTLMIISDTPRCDPDGSFAPIQTDFDRQFCADPVSGEVLEDFVVSKISREAEAMNCYCARARYLMRESATGKPQCCKNGNYRTLQHIGSTWFCADEYGRQNVTLEPVEVHEQYIDLLPCYLKKEADAGMSISEMGCLF